MNASGVGAENPRRWPPAAGLAWLALIVAVGLWRLAPGLAHPSIASWDESAHQAVTRGLRDTGSPVIYAHPLLPVLSSDWLNAGVFLHKPVLPFFLGSLLMRLTGVTPLALRLVSLGAALLTAWLLFLFAKPSVGRLGGLTLACAFLTLPFHWRLVQGYQFGDVTDCTLLFFIALAFWFQLGALETGKLDHAIWAGVALGLGFLCKSALALTPLAAAGAIVFIPLARTSWRLRLRTFVIVLVVGVAVAAPWNVYAAMRWPVLYQFEWAHTWGHLSGETVTNWVKPFDAIWNEIDELELEPFSPALVLLAGLFLLARGLKHRDEPRAVILSLWLLIEWTVLSVARAKVPAIAWGAVVPLLIGFGEWAWAARKRPLLAGALLGAAFAPQLAPRLPLLAAWREALPSFLVQTRLRPGLFEGLVLAALGAALAWIVTRPVIGRRVLVPVLGVAAVAGAAYVALVASDRALRSKVVSLRDQSLESYTDALGLALDPVIPQKSVLLLAPDRNRPCCFEKQNLMFWSGRMVYPRNFEQSAREHGYHPYLIASSAQPYVRVGSVTAASPLQAFDLEGPLPGPSPLPDGVREAHGEAAGVRLLGYDLMPGDAEQDRYVFYLTADKPQARVDLTFETKNGDEHRTLGPDLSLEGAGQLQNAAWYVLPVLGPKRNQVTGIKFGGSEIPRP